MAAVRLSTEVCPTSRCEMLNQDDIVKPGADGIVDVADIPTMEEFDAEEDLWCWSPPTEEMVSSLFLDFAATCSKNSPDLAALQPKAFVEQVLCSDVAIDSGDWLQPLYRKEADGTWVLSKMEVLFRVHDAHSVPFPAFPNFVKAATDQSSEPDPELRAAFEGHVVSSLRRVDARLSSLSEPYLEALREAGIVISLNATTSQIGTLLSVPLRNSDLISIEETEYDAEPEDHTNLRVQAWKQFAVLSFDDVSPSLQDFEHDSCFADSYVPPLAPNGQPFKAVPPTYNHDLRAAHRFIEDFRIARSQDPWVRGEIKLSECFCCYLVGVGYAPFSRKTMQEWTEQNAEASRLLKEAGQALIREALDAGMTVCLEVSFNDDEVRWLLEELPELQGCLHKQGGRSGAAAMPLSMVRHVVEPSPWN